jgi:hypothetical protein
MRRRDATTNPRPRNTASAFLFLGMLPLLLLGSSAAIADTLSLPNTFTNGEVADADEVNANFDAVKTEVDDNDVRIDAVLGQSCPASEVVTGVDASGTLLCTPSPPACPSVPPGCPASHAQRAAATVINELRVSIGAQDWTAVACNYAVDAFITDDQGILTGHLDIIAAKQSLSTLFNGIPATLKQQDTFQDTVRVLSSMDAGWIIIPDRVSTYVVECGIITRQTDHGLIEFTGPPP